MTASLAAANEISMNAALEAVLSELDDIFALKDRERRALEAFLGGKEVLDVSLTGFGFS